MKLEGETVRGKADVMVGLFSIYIKNKLPCWVNYALVEVMKLRRNGVNARNGNRKIVDGMWGI